VDDRTLARFMAKVEVRPNGCWIWTGKLNRAGYGYFWFEGKSRLVHRFAYKHFIGPIADEDDVDHVCHTRDESCSGSDGRCEHRACVNYLDGHLEAVTTLVNVMRSRGVAPANAAKDRCSNGHPFDEENTYWYPDGRERGCRTCRNEAWRRWRDKHMGADRVPHGNRTHCPQGHEYTKFNTRVRPGDGARICIECTRAKDREAKRVKRARERAARVVV
jgi:hypothetical protein